MKYESWENISKNVFFDPNGHKLTQSDIYTKHGYNRLKKCIYMIWKYEMKAYNENIKKIILKKNKLMLSFKKKN